MYRTCINKVYCDQGFRSGSGSDGSGSGSGSDRVEAEAEAEAIKNRSLPHPWLRQCLVHRISQNTNHFIILYFVGLKSLFPKILLDVVIEPAIDKLMLGIQRKTMTPLFIGGLAFSYK